MTIVREGLRWECIRCGKCCMNHFQEDWLGPILEDIVGKAVNGRCPRLDPVTHLCTDHENRPPVCRGFPFTLKRLRGQTYVLWVYPDCPGIGTGPPVNIRSRVEELVELAEAQFGITMDVNLDQLDGTGHIFIRNFTSGPEEADG